jgi:hypothetical protein
MTVVTAVTTTTIFVGVVAWAATQAGRDAERPGVSTTPGGAVRTYSSPDAPWTFEYPGGWNAATTVTFDPAFLANVRRTTVVNGALAGAAGTVGPHSEEAEAFTDAVGDAGAVVLIQRFWSHATGLLEPTAERAPGPFIDEAQSPGWSFRERARCERTLCFIVVEWLGPTVSDEDRAAAEAIAESVRLANVDRWIETEGGRTTVHDESELFTVTHPDDWMVADENLTPWLASPGEILSLGTFPLRVSTHPDDGLRLFDAPVAPAVLADMGARDAFVSVQEGGFLGGPERRPSTFRRDECGVAILGCGDYPSEGPFQAWWIPFEDEGRAFYLFVAIGNEAPPELVEETWAIADSLRFYPD